MYIQTGDTEDNIKMSHQNPLKTEINGSYKTQSVPRSKHTTSML